MKISAVLKDFICVIVVLSLLLCLCGCSTKESLPLNEVVENILAENGIEKSKITFLCESDNEIAELYTYTSVEVSDEELQKFVDDLLLSHEKMIEITDRNTVQAGDAIVVSYVVYYNSEMVANAENDPLMVGSGNYGEEFEDAVIGATVGEPFSCELRSPVDTDKYKKGDTLKYNITVESINYFESYTASDQYILDYYGCKTEEEFLTDCKVRLEQIKRYESTVSSYNEFLGKVTEKCKFDIDKKEAAAYSKKIVEEYSDLAYISGLELNEYIEQKLDMTEDEFYDHCYDKGVKEIKLYLLVGACTEDIQFEGNESFAEFCSMNGYDSTKSDNTQARYAYLKAITTSDFSHEMVYSVAHLLNFDSKKTYTVEIYDSSNIYNIDFSADKGYNVQSNIEQNIIDIARYLNFGYTGFENHYHLYDTVLIIKADGKNEIKLMVDNVNGYIKWLNNKGDIVVTELSDELSGLIKIAKQG